MKTLGACAKGCLFFVLRRQETYDRPLSGRVSRRTEDRYYFADERLVRWLDARGRSVSPVGDEFREAQKSFLGSSKLLLEGARSPDARIYAP